MEFGDAVDHEMDAIYRMGFDAWGGGLAEDDFIDVCRRSPKYRRGRWVVARDGSDPVASLLVHRFPSWEDLEIHGIGSVATSMDRRGSGIAAALVDHVGQSLVEEGAAILFLYSDIDPAYYERWGYRVLADAHQGHAPSVLMARLAPGIGPVVVEQNAHRLPRYS